MAQSIVLKRSALPGKVPDTGSLNLGEVAINTYDGKVYFKKSGSIESVESIITTNSTNTGSITLTQTGSFGEIVTTTDANIGQDLYVSNDIIGNGDIDVLGNITGSNLLIRGNIIAQQMIISSSVTNMTTQFASGSTVFGNSLDDTHQLTGSVYITGSGYINSYRIITDNETGSFSTSGGYPVHGVDYTNDLQSVLDFNNESPQFLIDYLYETSVGTEVGVKGFLGNTSGSTLVVPAHDYIGFVIDDVEVARVTATGFEGVSLPQNLVSGSSQLTSSYDSRYVLSGSITQTTWDNIANKPGGIISGSSQLNNTTIENLTIQNLTTINETASVIYSSGSNKFGDFGNDIHSFTGSVEISGSVTTIGNINGINLTSFSSSVSQTLNSLTESKVNHIVSSSGGLYYIDGIQRPSMSFVPGLTYRFDTTITSGSHPFKLSTSQNGPTEYVNGVTSGSNYIQIEINYDTPELLYYYCTLHGGMGNAINVLKIDKLLTSVSSSFDSRYVISGSITQTTWDNIANKPSGIISGSSQLTSSLDLRYALSGSTAGGILDSRSRYLSQSVAATTWSFEHNIGSDHPMVTVYNSNNEIVQPEYIKTLSSNQTEIGFGTPVSGIAVASLGSLTEVTGRTIRQNFTASVSWSFQHNVGDKYVMVQAFDSSDQMVIPADIKLTSTTSSIITFSEPVAGYALATIGGDLPSISASYDGYTLQVQSGTAIWAPFLSASVATASYVLPTGLPSGLISGSSQLPSGIISGSSQLTSSYDNRYILSGSQEIVGLINTVNLHTASINSFTASQHISNSYYATTGSNTFKGNQIVSGSITPSIDNVFDLGSTTNTWRDIYVSTASIKIVSSGSVVGTLSSNNNGDFNVSGQISASSIVGIGNANEFSTSVISRINQLSTKTGSIETQLQTIGSVSASINQFTSSTNIRLDNIETTTSSLNNNVSNLHLYTSSVKNAINVIGQGTSSVTTIYGNLVVEGTTVTVSASNLAVADNMIYLNDGNTITDPDLGIAGNYNDGTYRHAGLFSDASDSHTWKVYKGYTPEPSQSIDITHGSFTLADFQAATLKGAIAATNGVISSSAQLPNGTVSGSSQVLGILSSLNTYTGSNDTTNTLQTTRLDQFATYTGSNDTTNTSQNTRLSRIEESTSSLNTFSSSMSTTYEGRASASKTIFSGSSQVTFSGISSLPTLVSGSSQITAGSTTNFSTDVKSQLNSNTVVSGSYQITLSSTNGFGTYINQAVLTTSLPTFAGVKGSSYFDAQANSGFRIRNAADSVNTGGFTRRGLWEGNANYDPGIWAETGYGVYVYTNGSGNIRAYWDTSGHLLPGANSTYNLGSSSLRWANLYTNDLHLSNEDKVGGNDVDGTTGNWTIQEGEEHLYIINNKTGKKFKFSLEEIQ